MQKKTLLLVEDETVIALGEALMLEKYGYNVFSAGSGEEAIRMVKQENIDLILMDIDLGKGKPDGTEVAEIILKEHHVPIVFLTGHAEKEIVEKVKGITRYGYVLKTSGEFVLIQSINMAFELFEANRNIKAQEKKYHDIVDNVSCAIIKYDKKGKIYFFNKYAEKLFGFTAEEVLGKYGTESINPLIDGDGLNHKRMLENIIRNPEKYKYNENFNIRKDGKQLWISWRNSPIYDETGNRKGILCIANDITDKRKTRQDLLRKIEELTLLHKVNTAISFSEDIDKALSSVCSELAHFMEAPQSGMALFNENRSASAIVAEFHSSEVPEALGLYPPVADNPIMNILIQSREPFICMDPQNDPVLEPLHAAMKIKNIRAILIVPMIVNGEVAGTIGFDQYKKKEFETTKIEVIQNIANQVGRVILHKIADDQMRKSLEEKKILIKEIHHRIKNDLSMIDSLINLHSYKEDNEISKARFLDLKNQIHTIGIIHEKLYQHEEIINFRDYVRDVVESLIKGFRNNNIEVTYDIPDVYFETTISIPLGLIINELTMNALKYGFAEGGEKKYSIILNRDHSKENFILKVKNTGSPFPENIDFRNTDTLGMQLVCIFTEQLEGTVALNRTHGTEFIITFPAQDS